MAFNLDPNKQANEVLFSCKTKKVDHPPLIFNGFPVVQVKETKHLGLVLQSSLNFVKHLTEKVKRSETDCWYNETSKWPFAPENTQSNVQISCTTPPRLLRHYLPYTPHYSSPLRGLWDKPPSSDGVCRANTVSSCPSCHGHVAFTDRVKLYEELGWESLSDRRMLRRVSQLHKIVNGKTPSYLKKKAPPK